jgi:putative DNA modification/repair radical SAM protein
MTDLFEKLEILSAAAKFDVSCVSSGSNRKNKGGLGSGVASGICHSWGEDGRCISLLKILMTNYCIYDCTYCVNRCSNDLPRAILLPEEIIDLTMEFYRRNYIEGLFLSSGVIKSPDFTMEQILKIVKILRLQHNYTGYIHIKAIPGADSFLLKEAGKYVDRMSVNIELPSNSSLKLLAPQKTKESILKPMRDLSNMISESRGNYSTKRILPSSNSGTSIISNSQNTTLDTYSSHKGKKKNELFVPAGQSTQLIVGASPERDLDILKLTEGLYQRFKLKRVFYSAFIPVSNHPNLPAIAKPPLQREHRLYQADWLLRFYGFSSSELLDENEPNFSEEMDPKCQWAVKNLNLFPIEVNKASHEMLLRVPGIGVQSAWRIINARRTSKIGFEELKKIGVVMKRARFFITCQGKYMNGIKFEEGLIRNSITDRSTEKETKNSFVQLPLFNDNVLNTSFEPLLLNN